MVSPGIGDWLLFVSIFACLSQFDKHICLLSSFQISSCLMSAFQMSKININYVGARGVVVVVDWGKNKTNHSTTDF